MTAPSSSSALSPHPGDADNLDGLDGSSEASSGHGLGALGSPSLSPRAAPAQPEDKQEAADDSAHDETGPEVDPFSRNEGGVITADRERIVPHHPPILLPNTCRTR